MVALNGIDCSRYGGDLTREEVNCFLAAGVNTFVIATGPGLYGSETRRQSDDVVAAKGILEGYTFYEWGASPIAWINAGYIAFGEFAPMVERFWIDIEDTKHVVPANWRQAVETLFWAADEFYGGAVELYLPGWYARRYFSGLDLTTWHGRRRKLWNSYYDGDPDIDGLPYGGWTAADVAIEQYKGTTTVCGHSVDLNHVYIPARTIEEEGMTDDEKLAIFAGGEEKDAEGNLLSKASRLLLAESRIREAAEGRSQSVRELAATGSLAYVGLTDHALNHAAGVGGTVPEHEHVPGGVKR